MTKTVGSNIFLPGIPEEIPEKILEQLPNENSGLTTTSGWVVELDNFGPTMGPTVSGVLVETSPRWAGVGVCIWNAVVMGWVVNMFL